MSLVQTPLSIVDLTASSIAFASSWRLNEYCSIIAADRMAAMGLTMPLPPMSGAEPVVAENCQHGPLPIFSNFRVQ